MWGRRAIAMMNIKFVSVRWEACVSYHVLFIIRGGGGGAQGRSCYNSVIIFPVRSMGGFSPMITNTFLHC